MIVNPQTGATRIIESGRNIATNEHDCPYCKASKGHVCRTKGGTELTLPHTKRMNLMTKEQWDRCTITSTDVGEDGEKILMNGVEFMEMIQRRFAGKPISIAMMRDR